MNERITIDPRICGGQPVVSGTGILIDQLVLLIAGGTSFEELLDNYPTLEREDLAAILEYAAELVRQQRVVVADERIAVAA